MKHKYIIDKKVVFRFFLCLFSFLIFSNFVFSQENNANRPALKSFPEWEVGVFFGASAIFGDLAKSTSLTSFSTQPAYGISVVRNLKPNMGIRVNLLHTQLKSNDLDSQNEGHFSRGFNHETPLTELSAVFQYDFFGKKRYREVAKFKKFISPYIFAGIAGNFGEPEVFYGERTESPSVLEDQNNIKKFRMAIPFGGGVKFDLTHRSVVALEAALRPTFGDLLDGVSKSANPDQNDWYAFMGATLSYRFATDDADGDGVVDAKDRCPTISGEKKFRGCPDTDGDGIRDSDDLCPALAGSSTLKGCPDTDLDGVADREDECPNLKGMQRLQGCPDADWDNVPDHVDACPNQSGLAAFKGCPDTDLDGVMDMEDDCPEVAGLGSPNGCPKTEGDVVTTDENGEKELKVFSEEITDNTIEKTQQSTAEINLNTSPTASANHSSIQKIVTENDADVAAERATEKITMTFNKMILFPTAKNNLSAEDKGILIELIYIMKNEPEKRLNILGYADNVGNDVLNQRLSERRAKACYDYIKANGVEEFRMTYEGKGEQNPIATNDTYEGRAKNRRVSFVIY